ncbi:MAG: hypothetical protein HYY05_05000 [Chloroflexi bacterium]|nr:hypothetical protein [Chloroflexota bacterium]
MKRTTVGIGLVALALASALAPGQTWAALGPGLAHGARSAETADLAGWRGGAGPVPASEHCAESEEAAAECRQEVLVTFLNRWQSVNSAIGRSIVTYAPRIEEGATLWQKGDHERGFFLMTSGIDLMVKGIEPVLPFLQSLEPPEELADPVMRDLQGTELFFDALKRMNWGIVSKDDQILADALGDYFRSLETMSAAFKEVKAIAEAYAISHDEETGVWRQGEAVAGAAPSPPAASDLRADLLSFANQFRQVVAGQGRLARQYNEWLGTLRSKPPEQQDAEFGWYRNETEKLVGSLEAIPAPEPMANVKALYLEGLRAGMEARVLSQRARRENNRALIGESNERNRAGNELTQQARVEFNQVVALYELEVPCFKTRDGECE